MYVSGTNYTLEKTWESDDGRTAVFEGNITTGIFMVEGKLLIVTPIASIEYSVTWYVIPYFTPITISTIIILSVVGAIKYQKYVKKKRLERLREVGKKAEELAKEILKELKEEGVY